jgi:putative transcriptional regulator
MTTTWRQPPFFKRLKAGLQEGIQFAQGKLDLRTTVIPSLRAHDIRELRNCLQLSQIVFARILNVSVKTLQSWEQGTRRPSKGTLRLLQIVKERPALVGEVLGVPKRAV